MQGSTGRARVLRALSIFLAAASGTQAGSTTPPLLWRNATSVGVQCIVTREPFRNDPQLQATLCARLADLASRGAPIPVQVVPLGDPALVAPGRAGLLVHAAIEPQRGGRLIVFSIRPVGGSAESAILFGAAPRAVSLGERELKSAALDAALAKALTEILPWQARQQGAQPLPASR